MENKVLNGEQIRAKQQKQFNLVYVVGLILFIVLMVALNNNFNQDYKLTIDSKLLKAPNIINSKEVRGKELEEMLVSYEDFTKKVEELNLSKLDFNNFSFEEEKYHYVDANYTYIANDTYINLTRQGNKVYSSSLEDNVIKIEYYGENKYLLEYSTSNISFKVNDLNYLLNIENNNFVLECSYEMDGYTVTKEIYDKDWNFININAYYLETSNSYIGYLFDNLDDYKLSEDKNKIINKNTNEEYPVTKHTLDNQSTHYTTINYVYNEVSLDILLVNTNEEFPFN